MPEQNTSTFPNTSPRRLFIWVSAIVVCIVFIVVTMINKTAMAGGTMQQKDTVLAVITNSGSTNTPGSTLTLYQDGSGSLVYQKRPGAVRFASLSDKTFPAGTFDSQKLASLLTKIKDVGTIPNHGCLKSVSFGSTTTITVDGKTSGDLTCLSSQDTPAFLDLKHQVQTVHEQIQTSTSSSL